MSISEALYSSGRTHNTTGTSTAEQASAIPRTPSAAMETIVRRNRRLANGLVCCPVRPALPLRLSTDAAGGLGSACLAAIDASWNQTPAAQAIPQLPGPQTLQYRPPKPLDWPVTEVISDRGGIT